MYVERLDKKSGSTVKVKKKVTQKQIGFALESLNRRLMLDAISKGVYDEAADEREVPKTAAPLLDDEDLEFFVSQNRLLESMELDILARIEKDVKATPVWKEFLNDVKGCGPTMAGVLLSEIRMAEPVPWEEIRDNPAVKQLDEVTIVDVDGKAWQGFVATMELEIDAREVGEDGKKQKAKKKIQKRYSYFVKEGQLYRDFCPTVSSLWAFSGFAVDSESGKAVRKQAGKRINYSPFLKTKLFVLFNCFLKNGGQQKYAQTYRNFRHRYESSGWSEKKMHLMLGAARPAIKEFLKDLWVNWRRLEGFPVLKPYSEAVLGRVHGDHGGAGGLRKAV
jgi:hypothetical protein